MSERVLTLPIYPGDFEGKLDGGTVLSLQKAKFSFVQSITLFLHTNRGGRRYTHFTNLSLYGTLVAPPSRSVK